MRIRPWVPMPVEWILSGKLSEQFRWGTSGTVRGSAAIAAIQIWVVLLTRAEWDGPIGIYPTHTAELTYEALQEATGLSRKLIAGGLDLLVDTEMISIEKVGRSNLYSVPGFETGKWRMLPARAIYSGGRIGAFHMFHKRAVCELHALKLYLYYATVRDSVNPFSTASFEKINARTGVPEKMIPRANSFLLNAGLLVNITKDNAADSKWKQPNKYFLAGYSDLFVKKSGT